MYKSIIELSQLHKEMQLYHVDATRLKCVMSMMLCE